MSNIQKMTDRAQKENRHEDRQGTWSSEHGVPGQVRPECLGNGLSTEYMVR